jgi:glycosyltransferase involved in cell wall biosynthesis
MRVLLVQRSMRWGGSCRSLYLLASGLTREHEVAMGVYGEPPYLKRFEASGTRILRVRPRIFEQRGVFRLLSRLPLKRGRPTLMALPRVLLDYAPAAIAFARILRSERPDVVHTNENLRLNRAEVLGAMLAGVPVVSHVRGVHSLSRIDRIIARSVSAFIAVSRCAAQSYLEAGIPEERVNVVHNCVALPSLLTAGERARRRADLGLDGQCWLVTAGRLVGRKGNEEAIEAVARLRRRGLEVALLMLGDGPRADALRERALMLGIGEHVRLVGWQEDPVRFFLAADVVLLASQEPEGFPRSLLEGMACGLPVAATDLGGSREVFEAGVSGFLAEGPGVEPLVEVLEPLARHPERRVAMGRAAREEADRRHSPDSHVAAVLEVYGRVLTGGRIRSSEPRAAEPQV